MARRHLPLMLAIELYQQQKEFEEKAQEYLEKRERAEEANKQKEIEQQKQGDILENKADAEHKQKQEITNEVIFGSTYAQSGNLRCGQSDQEIPTDPQAIEAGIKVLEASDAYKAYQFLDNDQLSAGEVYAKEWGRIVQGREGEFACKSQEELQKWDVFVGATLMQGSSRTIEDVEQGCKESSPGAAYATTELGKDTYCKKTAQTSAFLVAHEIRENQNYLWYSAPAAVVGQELGEEREQEEEVER